MKRIPMINGDEYDALTGPANRKTHRWQTGEVAAIKRRYRRRERRIGKAETTAYLSY